MLREYEDLFLINFLEMKGIKGDLGEMRIELKPDVKLVKHRPYHLNPESKKKLIRRLIACLQLGSYS
jgi:hypothetical protein